MGILKSDRNYTVWAVVIIISDHEIYNSTSDDLRFTYLNDKHHCFTTRTSTHRLETSHFNNDQIYALTEVCLFELASASTDCTLRDQFVIVKVRVFARIIFLYSDRKI